MDINATDQNYVSFPLTKVSPEKALPGDLYFYIAGKFIKYLSKDDDLPREKYEYLSLKRFQYLFIKAEDLPAFSDWSHAIVVHKKEAMLEEVGHKHEEAVDRHIELQDEIITFVTKEVTDETVRSLIKKTSTFIKTMQEKKVGEEFLVQMAKFDKHIVDHATNVANISTFLAMSIGYNSPRVLENIYLGSLLHDFGKTRVSPKYLEKPKSDIYKSAMRKHPALGKTSLLLDSGFEDDVLRIVGEHHERYDGKGYPKGLGGKRIFDLTKIVSIANMFDKLVSNNPSSDLQVKQREALEKIKADQGRHFDPKVLAGCVRALQEVI